jgi:hypothetical protein
VARVVPVLDEWLLSGSLISRGPEEADWVLALAAEAAQRYPALLFRNPERLRLGWEMQRKDREGFVEFFGADLVVLTPVELERRWPEFWRFCHGDHAPDPGTLTQVTADAQTVGLIHDEQEGLGFFVDFGLFQEVFEHPELVTKARYAQVVLTYLDDDSVSPVPLRRCAARWPDGADAVFAHLLHNKRFSWQRHGEELLRRHKATYVDREPLPRFLPFGNRMVEFLQRTREDGSSGASPR